MGETRSAGESIVVLVVDDEPMIRLTLRRVLEALDYGVLEAKDGIRALEVFAAHPEIAVVLLDLTMPGMSGEATFRELRRVRPDALIVLCSGYHEHDAVEALVEGGNASFLPKPYTLDELDRCLRTLLEPVG